jgi:uncharacterized protein (TIGR02996 family)
VSDRAVLGGGMAATSIPGAGGKDLKIGVKWKGKFLRRYSAMGHTHADFANRIIENPEELSTSDAYSDWLEENNMPGVAKIVRDHVAMGRKNGWGAWVNTYKGRHSDAVERKHPGVPYIQAWRNDGPAYGVHADTVSVATNIYQPGQPTLYHATVLPRDHAEALLNQLESEGHPGVQEAKVTAGFAQPAPKPKRAPRRRV